MDAVARGPIPSAVCGKCPPQRPAASTFGNVPDMHASLRQMSTESDGSAATASLSGARSVIAGPQPTRVHPSRCGTGGSFCWPCWPSWLCFASELTHPANAPHTEDQASSAQILEVPMAMDTATASQVTSLLGTVSFGRCFPQTERQYAS